MKKNLMVVTMILFAVSLSGCSFSVGIRTSRGTLPIAEGGVVNPLGFLFLHSTRWMSVKVNFTINGGRDAYIKCWRRVEPYLDSAGEKRKYAEFMVSTGGQCLVPVRTVSHYRGYYGYSYYGYRGDDYIVSAPVYDRPGPGAIHQGYATKKVNYRDRELTATGVEFTASDVETPEDIRSVRTRR